MKKKASKRVNRTIGLNEAVAKAIGPVFQKRGFASRDIITQWQSIAPAPYNRVAIPDRLAWRRGTEGAEGAILYLRCSPSHSLALTHESANISAAVNRYFGYVLVGEIRLSIEPFSSGSDEKKDGERVLTSRMRETVDSTISHVEDEDLKEALRRLGHGLTSRKKQN